MVKLTDNEWAILEVLWADGPCELGDLVSALAPTPPGGCNRVRAERGPVGGAGFVGGAGGAGPAG